MGFVIKGLDANEFRPLFARTDADLAKLGVIAKIADAKPGFPCRITLEDADPGERVLLLNHESHRAATPYRSSYAIFVRDGAEQAAIYENDLPPVMARRPIALRIFNADRMLIGADLGMGGAETKAKILAAFDKPHASYIHAHNAMHGCFVAAISRA